MSYAWDMFCPRCSSTLLGGMGEGGDEEIEADQQQYSGKLVLCTSCGTYTDFDTGQEANPTDYFSGDIIQGG